MLKVYDEATKNHKELDQPIKSNFMPENKTDRQCPVHSYKLYISHLHPQNEYLWQQPNLHPKMQILPFGILVAIWERILWEHLCLIYARKSALWRSTLTTACMFQTQISSVTQVTSLTKKLWKTPVINLLRVFNITEGQNMIRRWKWETYLPQPSTKHKMNSCKKCILSKH